MSVTSRSRFPTPWGLFIALGLYAAVVAGYLAIRWWTSPEYKASKEYAAAWQLLGKDRGRHCTRDELDSAYAHLVQAAQQMPQVRELHEDIEEVGWRLDEHHWRPRADLQAAADALGVVWAQTQERHGSLLESSLRDQGWDPESLQNGPGHALAWSLAGAIAIVIVWAYLRLTARGVQGREKEGRLRQLEREAVERGAQRRPPTE
jgi:hypothetical protein